MKYLAAFVIAAIGWALVWRWLNAPPEVTVDDIDWYGGGSRDVTPRDRMP